MNVSIKAVARGLLISLPLIVPGATQAQNPGYTFEILPITSFYPMISKDGNTIVGDFDYWTRAQGDIQLKTIPGFYQQFLTGVSRDGNTFTGCADDSAFVIHKDSTYTLLPKASDDLNAARIEANGISGDASTLLMLDFVDVNATSFMGHILKAPQSYTNLGLLKTTRAGGPMTFANAASEDGSVIVGGSGSTDSMLCEGDHPFRWTAAGGIQDLGIPSYAKQAVSRCTSSDGSIVYGFTEDVNGFPGGFRWTAQTGMVGMPNFETNLCSDDGTVVAGVNLANYEAGLWTANGGEIDLRDLLIQKGGVTQLQGAYGFFVSGMSGDGTKLVGSYMQADGTINTFLATIPSQAPVVVKAFSIPAAVTMTHSFLGTITLTAPAPQNMSVNVASSIP